MKITINGTTYQSGKITATMSMDAMELNMQALDAAAGAEALRANPAAEGASDLLRALYKNMTEKAELICEVFDHAFTAEDLLNNITPAEMNGLLNAIVKGN